MRMYDIIAKKRDGEVLTQEEIQFFIDGYTSGEIPVIKQVPLPWRLYFQGMNKEERAAITMAMAQSGDMIDLSEIEGTKVDKHSTGGVGDTTTLDSRSTGCFCWCTSCEDEWKRSRPYWWND